MITFTMIAILSILGILLWYRRWNTSSSVKSINHLPGPRKFPLTGNIFSVPRNSIAYFRMTQKEWVKIYGHIFRIWRMMSPSVVISSPELIEKIIAGQKHLEKGSAYKFIVPWMGDGLLLSKGDKWKKDRRMLTPSFHFQILEGFFDDFNRNADILNRIIEEKLSIDRELDIFPLLSACTLDIISEAAMGNQVNAQLSGSDYTEALTQMLPMLRERYTSLFGILPDWLYRKTPHGRKYEKCLDIVHSFAASALKDRQLARKKQQENHIDDNNQNVDNGLGMKKRKAFLDIMLDVAEETAGEMSEDNILDQINTFMFAGHDTTSVALTWALYCLATHPYEQEKVYEELADVFDGSERPCTLEDLSHLTYLDCCVKESIRRHPSVPLIRRAVSEDVQLGKYMVPAGTTVAIQIYALHHNEEHFPDPELFNPERFLPEESAKRHPYAFIPFSAGSRNCIGQKYAVYEEKVILASLLRKFRFSIDPARLPIRETSDGVLKPSGGMHLIIQKRTNN